MQLLAIYSSLIIIVVDAACFHVPRARVGRVQVAQEGFLERSLLPLHVFLALGGDFLPVRGEHQVGVADKVDRPADCLTVDEPIDAIIAVDCEVVGEGQSDQEKVDA